MTRPEEDEAWRAIVENYGERPVIDEPPSGSASPKDDLTSAGVGPRMPSPEPVAEEPDYHVSDRFLPPDPPPIPLPPPPRLLAWLGLFGAPALLLICLVLGIRLPSLVSLALVTWFAGGFGYLVWHMPKGPSDPWDNGARV